MSFLDDACKYVIEEHGFPFIDNISESSTSYSFKYIEGNQVSMISLRKDTMDTCEVCGSVKYDSKKVPSRYTRLAYDSGVALSELYDTDEYLPILDRILEMDIPCGTVVYDIQLLVRYALNYEYEDLFKRGYYCAICVARQQYGVETPLATICDNITDRGESSIVCITEYEDGYSFTLTDYCELSGDYKVVRANKSGVVLNHDLSGRYIAQLPVTSYKTRTMECVDIIRMEYPDCLEYRDLLLRLLDCRFTSEFGAMDIVLILRYWDKKGLSDEFMRLDNQLKLRVARKYYFNNLF